VGPDAEEAEFVAVLEPERDLLDGGLFEVVGQRGLTGAGGFFHQCHLEPGAGERLRASARLPGAAVVGSDAAERDAGLARAA